MGALAHEPSWSYRTFERLGTDALERARELIGRVLTDRKRQQKLFEAEVLEIPQLPVRVPPGAQDEIAAVLSPSQVRTFIDCQVRWYYKHVLRLREGTTAARLLGSSVHEALGANFAQKVTTHEDLGIEEVVRLFRADWAARTEYYVFAEKESPRELEEQGAALVRLYMTEAAPTIQPAAVEISIEGEVGGVPVRGRIDLLDESGAIVDIKTAAKTPSDIDQMYRFQLATYRPFTPGASGLVQLDTLVKNKAPKLVRQPWEITGQDLQACEVLYPLARDAMRQGYYMPGRTSMMCSRRQCSFWRRCQTEYGGTVPE